MSKLQEATQALAEAFAAVIVAARTASAAAPAEAEAAAVEEVAAPKGKKGKKATKATPTLEQVRAAMIALAEAKDKQAVVEVLSRFGVGKIGDLDAANYAECIELAEAEAVAEEEGESEEDPFAE